MHEVLPAKIAASVERPGRRRNPPLHGKKRITLSLIALPAERLAKDAAMKRLTAATITVFGLVVFGPSAQAEEKFQRLTGAQIQARFSGMEMTDEVHWGDVYDPNGTLRTYSMGRKTVGKWRVQKNELCLDRGKEEQGCYEVWLSGKKVELRRAGSDLPLEGVLQRPTSSR